MATLFKTEQIPGFPRITKAYPGAGTAGTGAMFADFYANMIYVGSTGHVQIVLEDGNTVKFHNIIAGQWLTMPPFKDILSGGDTTAAQIVVGAAFR